MQSTCKKISGRPLASPENGNTEKLKLQTFLITLSPKTDVTEDTQTKFVKYIQKMTTYHFIVGETSDNGKYHIHACCVWSHAVDKRNIHDYWSKLLVKDYPGSIGRYACKITTQYNHTWYDEYLRKGGTVLSDNYVRDEVTRFFPTEEQQSQLIELKGNTEARLHLADQLLIEWVDKDPTDATYEGAIRFLKYRMYVENKTPYYIDNRKLCQICWFLYEKRNKILEPNVEEKNFGNKMTGNMSTF